MLPDINLDIDHMHIVIVIDGHPVVYIGFEQLPQRLAVGIGSNASRISRVMVVAMTAGTDFLTFAQ
jgi:hypothetical protein